MLTGFTSLKSSAVVIVASYLCFELLACVEALSNSLLTLLFASFILSVKIRGLFFSGLACSTRDVFCN